MPIQRKFRRFTMNFTPQAWKTLIEAQRLSGQVEYSATIVQAVQELRDRLKTQKQNDAMGV